MKVGFFGGSFDPIHRGHVEPVARARERLGLDEVRYLVTGRPPHKPDRELVDPVRRFVMVELALLEAPGLVASTLELDRREPSYTVETLETVRREEPDVEPWLLVGADSLAELPGWRRWREIPRLARVGVMARPGWPAEGVLEGADPAIREWVSGGRIVVLETPEVDVSSTEIRRFLSRGESPPEGTLAPAVLNYLRKYSLYYGERSDD